MSTPLKSSSNRRDGRHLRPPCGGTRFLPDGNKLAVTMDDHYDTKGFKTHLLILDVQNPQKAFRQFDLQTCGNFLAWAPGGNALLVCGTVVRLGDGSRVTSCRHPLSERRAMW